MLHLALSIFQNTRNSLRAIYDSYVLPYLRRFISPGRVLTSRHLSFLNSFRRRQMGAFVYLAESDGSRIHEARKFMDSCSFCPFSSPVVMSREEVSCQHLSAEWVVSSGDAVVLYFHGGGLFFSALEKRFMLALSHFFRSRVFLPHYRLAPEHDFLSQYDDALISYQYLLRQGVSPANITVVGQSWGSSLALSLLLQLQKRSLPQPASAVLMSPFLSTSWDRTLRDRVNYRGDWLLSDHVFSHRRLMGSPSDFVVDSSWSKLPPIIIQAGQDDFFVPSLQQMFSDASCFNENLRLHLYPNMTHNFHHLYELSVTAEQALEDAGRFIESQSRL
ncbi:MULTISPECIES: alpha/beta hydrolase fold domain-containing protein [Candidatus Ichthyocystis]|uniref:Putative alpha/beta hydrolase fold protein n=1 Tax=Candidatus Ichthyocystis hellenicum TaxID=1561003 RepID=A0A0S4M2U6_9BURK|nr:MULTISPECIES: alpha/beta hydrolase [Ichthyocystis]CUT18099.1 putative alpha/beta hydrolase fold protein [Candidatus Ichthyocystis hellenicum]